LIFLIWVNNFLSLFFFKESFDVFFEIFLSSLNETRINFLENLLFLDDVFDVTDLMSWDVLDVSASSFTDDDLNCSKIFLRFFSHFAKSMISRVTIRMTLLKNFWLNAQSVDTEFFSLVCSKYRTMFCRSCLLDAESLMIAEKFELLFTNWRRRWACRIVWSLKDECFEVRLINRELFTQSKKSKLSKLRDEWRSEKERWRKRKMMS
jgi:hypothetical protein